MKGNINKSSEGIGFGGKQIKMRNRSEMRDLGRKNCWLNFWLLLFLSFLRLDAKFDIFF